jgi:hypothetical protein
MAFSDWLLTEPGTRNGWIGVLADYARSEPDWPKGAGKEEVWDFVVRNGEEFHLNEIELAHRKFQDQR